MRRVVRQAELEGRVQIILDFGELPIHQTKADRRLEVSFLQKVGHWNIMDASSLNPPDQKKLQRHLS